MKLLHTISFVLLAVLTAAAAEPPKKTLPLEGEVFEVAGRTAFLIPAKADPHATAKPWVWYAPTLPNLPGPEERWMFEKFRAAGIAIAGIDAGESYGSPAGNKVFDALHAAMLARGYSPKPVLMGRSRGGLMTLSWATANPDKVAAFAGIYPVCDIASYPGIERAAGAFNLKPDVLKEKLKEFNPVDRLEGLAKAKVPLFAIHGDVDKVVPLEANSGRMKERFTALGGSMTLIVPPQQGHNMWSGFFQCHELVQFVISHAGVGLLLDSPQDFQVVQRNAKNRGTIHIRGTLGELARKGDTIEFRLGTGSKPGEWRKFDATLKDGTFSASVEEVAGGWYRLDVRASMNGKTVAQASVERVGVGEVFVVAGQSNSANHGAEKQTTKTNRVAAFDGTRWQSANDPQPGASGNGGSFLPPFGDAIAEKFSVPVGIIACGVGATSVREWLPKGATFPNPPTIEGRVRKLADGTWESKGELYESFRDRLKQLGPNGFRAVLWHQGESDANQKDTTRTLPGKLYREYLVKLIRDNRKDIGWDAPWFVAQVSYHGPDDEGSPDIREAQASLWKDGLAIEGPDSDALKGELRNNGGKGVHFSGPGLRAHAAKWAEKVSPWLERQSLGKVGEPAPTVTPLVQTIDLNVGESRDVELTGGKKATVKLLELKETRDDLRGAVRIAEATVEVNGKKVTLVSANYRLPETVAGVQIDCPVTKGFRERTSTGNVWGLDKDARLRLWPEGSPLMNPGTFRYPAKQRWFASGTQMANEPVHVDGGEVPGNNPIYYHYGLDIGGAEGLVEVIAATDGEVVSSGKEAAEGVALTPVKPRHDVVYLKDARGWYYRYSHLHTIDPAIKVGATVKMGQRVGLLGKEGGSGGWSHLHFDITARQPSGKWGIVEGYAFLWEAYIAEHKPKLLAMARPHQLAKVGEKVVLDGSRSWSADAGKRTHEWTYTDGKTATGERVERTYEKPGVYSEVLKFTDAAGRVDYDFAVVNVLDKDQPDKLSPSIHAAYYPTMGLKPGDKVTFLVRTFRTVEGKEVWDYGDGSPKEEVRSDGNAVPLAMDGYARTVHHYETPGHYLVRVERTNSRGETAVARLHVRVGLE